MTIESCPASELIGIIEHAYSQSSCAKSDCSYRLPVSISFWDSFVSNMVMAPNYNSLFQRAIMFEAHNALQSQDYSAFIMSSRPCIASTNGSNLTHSTVCDSALLSLFSCPISVFLPVNINNNKLTCGNPFLSHSIGDTSNLRENIIMLQWKIFVVCHDNDIIKLGGWNASKWMGYYIYMNHYDTLYALNDLEVECYSSESECTSNSDDSETDNLSDSLDCCMLHIPNIITQDCMSSYRIKDSYLMDEDGEDESDINEFVQVIDLDTNWL